MKLKIIVGVAEKDREEWIVDMINVVSYLKKYDFTAKLKNALLQNNVKF